MTTAHLSVPGSGYSICHAYDDRTPILAVNSAVFSLTITPADADAITGDEVAFAEELAEQARRYALECARFAERQTANHSAGEAPEAAA